MINVVKSVIIKNDKMLLIKRSPASKFFPSLWDLPGGQLEQNEEALEGLKRETLEETSLNIEPDKLVCKFDYVEHDTKIIFQVFSIKSAAGNIKLSNDHTEFKWFSKEELKTSDLAPIVKMYLKS